MRSDPQSAALVRGWQAVALCGALVLAARPSVAGARAAAGQGRWVATWATAFTPRVDAATPAQNPPAAPAPAGTAATADAAQWPADSNRRTVGSALQQPDDPSDRAYQCRWVAGPGRGEQHIRDVAARYWRGADCDARQRLVDRAAVEPRAQIQRYGSADDSAGRLLSKRSDRDDGARVRRPGDRPLSAGQYQGDEGPITTHPASWQTD